MEKDVIYNDADGTISLSKKLELSPNTHVYNDHAMIANKITLLRDINTPSSQFRQLVEEITMLMCFEPFANLPLEDYEVETPICRTVGKRIAGKKLVLLPVMRAGLAMEPAMKRIIPQARTGHLGLYRDEVTLEPQEYFFKAPNDVENRAVFILDPMFATGGSINRAIKILKKIGCKTITVMSIIAAPEGIDLIQNLHPEVEIYVAHLDEGLNKDGFIVPGLGDAGDRIFGTK